MQTKLGLFVKDLLESCKRCNLCFKDCYAFHKSNFRIMRVLPDFFKDGKYTKEVREFLDDCLYCKAHEHSCKFGIDLTLLLPAIKEKLRRLDPEYLWVPPNVPKAMIKFLGSENFYRFWRNLNYYIIPKDFRRKFQANRIPKRREIVFFSGCGIQLLENQYYTLCEIFQKLDVDFGLIDGSYELPVCCGAVHCELGNFENGIYMLRNLVNQIKRFKTKRVVVYCATCYYGLKVLAPYFIEDYDLEVIHASTYLAEILKQKKDIFQNKNSSKTISLTIHDSCHLAHGNHGDHSGIRELISLLPNYKIIEMKHNRQNSLCDLYYIIMALRNPLTFLFRKNKIYVIEEALDTNADILCSLCPGCHALLSIFGSDIFATLGLRPKPIQVRNWVQIVGKALGIEKKDMLTHRFTHIFSIPFKESGFWYILQVFKSIIRGFFGKKEPPLIQKKFKKLSKKLKNI
ncbi:MAG: (Fe-S)-binding protein [Promethearchaeota archaeon]